MNSATRALQSASKDPLDLGAIVAALSVQYVVATGSRQFVRSARLDTFDRRLRTAGLTLEHQRLASGERLVLGQVDGSTTLTVPAAGLRWPALADSLPELSVREVLAPVTGIRALMVVSDQRRQIRRLELHDGEGKTVARVELDEPASQTSPGAPAEVWVRTLRGYEKQARLAADVLAGLGLRVAEDDEPGAHRAAPSAPCDRAVPAPALLARVLRDFHASMRENLPGLLDDVDTEFLHDFRVAVRRTRSTLKLGRPALPESMRTEWEPAFKWLGDLTTPVRDLDVYQLSLPTMASWLVGADPKDLEYFATHLRSRRGAERRALVRGLKSARFRRLDTEWEEELARLADSAHFPDDVDMAGVETGDGDTLHLETRHVETLDVDSGDEADREHLSAGRLADESISRAYAKVSRGGAAIEADSPAEDLHGLRKRCKELRYALEVFAPVIDDTARKRTVADLKGLQDVLGRFQDTEVERQALRGFAEEMMVDGTPAVAVLAMGELIGHLDVEQDRARREFDVAFARFVRPSNRRLMHRLGGGK
jgi:CHAD domain-containing protein